MLFNDDDVISNIKAFQSDMNSISGIWFMDIVNMAPPIVATAIVAFLKWAKDSQRNEKNHYMLMWKGFPNHKVCLS